MSAEQIKAAVDAAIDAKVILSYSQLFLVVLLAGIATHEDVERLNRAVEEMKAAYSKQLEDYKADITRRSRAAEVAEFLTHWSSPNADFIKLNGYAMTLSLWLPDDLYCDLARCVCYAEGAKTSKQILIDVRRYLLKGDAGNLIADNIIHFMPPPPAE
jgi:hypothetical protein